MRLGIFGGSFDPVHYGHLLLAEACREAAGLDEVWFMPAALAPHKTGQPAAPVQQRIEMLELALGGCPALRVSRLEAERGGVSFTVDTLAALWANDPARQLHLLLGADMLADLPNWHAPERIVRLARLVVAARPGSPPFDLEPLRRLVADSTQELPVQVVQMPLVGYSSSEIRARVACGRSIRFQTPRAVEEYIRAHGLYAGSSGSP